MKTSYKRLNGLSNNNQTSSNGIQQTRDIEHQNELKLQFFQKLSEELFKSFDQQVSCDDIKTLFNTVVPWLEFECNPSRINEIVKQLIEQIQD